MTNADEFRTDPDATLGERASLDAFLDYHRGTLLWKCAGLTDEQLATAACPPSDLTLLGLLRHLTEVESGWFSWLAGAPPNGYTSEERPDADFEDLTTHPVAEVLERYRAECERSRVSVGPLALDDTRTDSRGQVRTVRWVYLHMLEEYARHNGHADLLRQALDGATGE